MEKKNLGVFEVDVEYCPEDKKLDVYISHEGNSGSHYEHVDANKVGKLVADEIESIAEAYDCELDTSNSLSKEKALLALLTETIPEDPNEFNSETGYGEPQHWMTLPHGRSLEIVYEETGDDNRYYSWRVYCSEKEFDNDDFHGTMGVIDQTSSDDMKFETRVKKLIWAIDVASLNV